MNDSDWIAVLLVATIELLLYILLWGGLGILGWGVVQIVS